MKQAQTKALNADDINLIRKRLNTPLFILAGFAIITDIIMLTLLDIRMVEILIAIAALNLVLFILFVFIYKRGQKDIDLGYKYVISGRITDKYIRAASKSNVPYLVIEGVPFFVSFKFYRSYEINDMVELHYTAFTKIVIFIRRVEIQENTKA